MKFEPKHPPRKFLVGRSQIYLADCGELHLDPNELVTFKTDTGAEYDVVRKNWGFYATPSMNGRLLKQGFKSALTRGPDGKTYVLLVESGQESAFLDYLKVEGHSLLEWLHLGGDGKTSAMPGRPCICGSTNFELLHTFHAPPPREIRFRLLEGKPYHRELARCLLCGHFLSSHHFDDSLLYNDDYVTSNYGNSLKSTFAKITALPPERSDNFGRVNYVSANALAWREQNRLDQSRVSVLDVGSGLCVFLHGLRAKYPWDCHALDPDARSAEHARDLGFTAYHGDFFKTEIGRQFDLITLNKVIEHAQDPVAMLRRARELLSPGGVMYVEVPDGECAIIEGPEREEFTIDHPHVFSAASLTIALAKAGLELWRLERLQEPSTKFSLRALAYARR